LLRRQGKAKSEKAKGDEKCALNHERIHSRNRARASEIFSRGSPARLMLEKTTTFNAATFQHSDSSPFDDSTLRYLNGFSKYSIFLLVPFSNPTRDSEPRIFFGHVMPDPAAFGLA
jgi:hypothetical protein